MAQLGMIAVGVLAVLLNINPVKYLQALVVFDDRLRDRLQPPRCAT